MQSVVSYPTKNARFPSEAGVLYSLESPLRNHCVCSEQKNARFPPEAGVRNPLENPLRNHRVCSE